MHRSHPSEVSTRKNSSPSLNLIQFCYTHFIISCSAGILVAGWTHFHGFPNELIYGSWGFFSTLAVYTAQRVYKSTYGTTPVMPYSKNKEGSLRLIFLILVSSILAVSLLFAILHASIAVYTVLGFACLIACFYVVPFFGHPLREIPLTKNASVAFTWTLLLIAFPLVNEGVFTANDCLISLAFFLFFLGLAVLFDLRDVKQDLHHFTTLPHALGRQKTVFIASLLFGMYVLISILRVEQFKYSIGFWLLSFTVLGLIIATHEKRSFAYFALLDLTIAGYGGLFFAMA